MTSRRRLLFEDLRAALIAAVSLDTRRAYELSGLSMFGQQYRFKWHVRSVVLKLWRPLILLVAPGFAEPGVVIFF